MEARPWQTQQLWDWSPCCSADITKNFFFGLIATLFGYTVRSCLRHCWPGRPGRGLEFNHRAPGAQCQASHQRAGPHAHAA